MLKKRETERRKDGKKERRKEGKMKSMPCGLSPNGRRGRGTKASD
jgi:hypothetical protein